MSITDELREFIAEHQTGKCEEVHPSRLTFLDGKELFDQYIWEEA